MSLAFLAFSPSSSVSRSLMGSVCFFTHFFRAKGFTRPQKPSLAALVEGEAVACCCAAEGGVSRGVPTGCACWASAGNPTTDASRSTASWLGEGVEFAALLFMEGFPRLGFCAGRDGLRDELCYPLTPDDCNRCAKAEPAQRDHLLHLFCYIYRIYPDVSAGLRTALTGFQPCSFWETVYFLPGKTALKGSIYPARGRTQHRHSAGPAARVHS